MSWTVQKINKKALKLYPNALQECARLSNQDVQAMEVFKKRCPSVAPVGGWKAINQAPAPALAGNGPDPDQRWALQGGRDPTGHFRGDTNSYWAKAAPAAAASGSGGSSSTMRHACWHGGDSDDSGDSVAIGLMTQLEEQAALLGKAIERLDAQEKELHAWKTAFQQSEVRAESWVFQQDSWRRELADVQWRLADVDVRVTALQNVPTATAVPANVPLRPAAGVVNHGATTRVGQEEEEDSF